MSETGGRGEHRDSGNKRREREGVGGTLLYLGRGNKSGRGYFETSLSRRNVVISYRAFGSEGIERGAARYLITAVMGRGFVANTFAC